MTKQYNIADELRKHIERKYKNQSAAARKWGVSPAYVSRVLSGEKAPNDTMLNEAGFEAIYYPVRYVRRKSA